MNRARAIIHTIFTSITLLFTSLSVAATPDHAAETLPTLVLVGAQDTYDSPLGTWLNLIYTDALYRLGYQLEYRPYPNKRANALSDAGKVDGEIHRIANYNSTHPNILRIEEPHFSISWSAYAVRPNIKLKKWDDLKGSTYLVGYRAGTQKPLTMLPPLLPASQLIAAQSVESGLGMLTFNRIDLYVDVKELVDFEMKNTLSFKKIYEVAPLETTPMYAFLHKKHQNLIAPLTIILKDMKKEGLIETYRSQAYDHNIASPTSIHATPNN